MKRLLLLCFLFLTACSDSNEAIRCEVADKSLCESAIRGDVDAQLDLALIYYRGDDVNDNYHQAFQWFKKAANKGDADAQGMLGGMYYEGKGVRQNKRLAKEWFGKACDNGNQNGCWYYKKLNELDY